MATLRIALVVSVAVSAWATPPARAGGFGIPEIGVRRTAMGAVIGRPDELSSLYHNPAGLVLEDRWRIYMSTGLSLLGTEFQLQPWDRSDEFLGTMPQADGYYAPVKPSRAMGVIPMIAAGGRIRDRLYAGGALYVGNATGAAFPESAVTHYHLIDGYVVAPQLVASVAYNVRPDLALAATAGVINMRVHGKRYVFPVIDGNDISMLAGTKPELVLDGQAWAPTWSVSAFGRPHPRVTWGAMVVGKVTTELEGPVTITYSDDASTPGDKLEGHQKTEQMLPWTFQAGANVDVTPNVEIGTEFRYWLYRQYKRQHTDIVGIFLVRELNTEKNYTDSWESTGGIRVHDLRQAKGLDLMLGGQYDKSPAPAKTVTLDQPSFSHWGLHSGARYSVGRYRVGASYIHYWYQIPTITDSITLPASNVRGHGANNIFTLSIEATL
ncbi:MAG TPA: outer membrane protein transport protein [Kofleriaceae bacterium]|nr:outer membrane protein transport protein [Kofleriaceae bacterium]